MPEELEEVEVSREDFQEFEAVWNNINIEMREAKPSRSKLLKLIKQSLHILE